MTKIILDTSVIVRYLTGDNPELCQIAKQLFDLVKLGKVKAYLEQTVFTETIFVLSSKFYQVPREVISETLRDLLFYKGIHNPEKEILLASLSIYTTTTLSIVDCIIVAKAQVEQLDIKSFDKQLLKYSENYAQNDITQK